MPFRDLQTIPIMFRELSGEGQIEEAFYQAELRRRGWYWSVGEAHRELVRLASRAYQRQPRVRAAEADRMHRRRRALERTGDPRSVHRLLREQLHAGRALNKLITGAA